MEAAVPSLLPATATAEMQAVEQAMAAPLAGLPVETLTDLWNPDRCPAWFLPHLAQAVRVVLWRSDWPEATRRRMIADSWQINALRGKVSGIELALSAIGWPGQVIEWHEQQPEGRRGTFAVRLGAVVDGFAADHLADLHAVIRLTKRHSQHLDALTLTDQAESAALHVGITGCMVYRLITSPALFLTAPATPARPDLTVGVATVSRIVL
ncbi:phage tail protein I [Insolitispirillum peregrinum]|uniref:Phage tail protein, P2 protein I family n=1 Tax=Insolitispirillum peregrinum TaxID=80876 RepID=A0A1N7LRG2_9PROT|nr:phage tail protein I [Insolitispirillum peregrinum]SIS76430.1 phage tail protein, P2 protein I family [Insolitispirillum peregrinum]